MSTSIDDSSAAQGSVPRHVAVIMDGNNRWAKKRFMPGVAGHKAGVDAVRAVVETSARNGVEVLTLFAFSSENWRRPEKEVSALMQLFIAALQREVKKLHKNNIRLKVMGDLSAFSEKIRGLVAESEDMTRDNDAMTLVIAANYGGQWDIAQAARRMAEEVKAGTLQPEDITEHTFHHYTWLNEFPAPDLMIRTGGEQRISNFMLWQTAYAEFYFTDVLWPDFNEAALPAALIDFQSRKRRFGGVEPVEPFAS